MFSEPELDSDPFLASVALLLAVSWFGRGDYWLWVLPDCEPAAVLMMGVHG